MRLIRSVRMLFRHCTWAVLLLLATGAQAQEATAPTTRGYTIFLKGTPIGREDVTVRDRRLRRLHRQPGPNVGAVERHDAARRGEVQPRLDAPVVRARRHRERRRRDRHLHLRRQRGAHQRNPDRRALFARAHHLAAVGRAAAKLVLRRLRGGEPPLVNAPAGTELRAYVLPQGETTIKLLSSAHRADPGRQGRLRRRRTSRRCGRFPAERPRPQHHRDEGWQPGAAAPCRRRGSTSSAPTSRRPRRGRRCSRTPATRR